MKLAIVVQRYGADINGGAELHARYIAERLAAQADVRVLTTCARDYLTWRNEFPPGPVEVNGVRVERFAVSRERNLRRVRSPLGARVRPRSIRCRTSWTGWTARGPSVLTLLARLRRWRRRVRLRAVLQREISPRLPWRARRSEPRGAGPDAGTRPGAGPRAVPADLPWRSRHHVQLPRRARAHPRGVRQRACPGRRRRRGVRDSCRRVASNARRQTFGLRHPFVIYVGRIDANKGCAELFDFFIDYVDRRESQRSTWSSSARRCCRFPAHPRIRHLGYVSDQDKFDAIAAAEALVMPSRYESLSMVALEAWALGRPVLANARCDVLVGQCIRSNAGLYYGNAQEFAGTLDALLGDPALGGDARAQRPRVLRAPLQLGGDRAAVPRHVRTTCRRSRPRAAMEPLPGWWERRRRVLPPAAEVVDALPAGPVLMEARA